MTGEFENEIWKPVPDFQCNYECSNYSRVRNKITGVVLTPHLHHSGYYTHCFKVSGSKPKYMIRSRIVAKTWIDNPLNKKEVNHKNGIKADDSIVNLEWSTPSENIQHYYDVLKKGLQRKVVKMDMEGNEISIFDSLSKAVRSLNNPKASIGNICLCCKNKLNYSYGHKWKYA